MYFKLIKAVAKQQNNVVLRAAPCCGQMSEWAELEKVNSLPAWVSSNA